MGEDRHEGCDYYNKDEDYCREKNQLAGEVIECTRYPKIDKAPSRDNDEEEKKDQDAIGGRGPGY